MGGEGRRFYDTFEENQEIRLVIRGYRLSGHTVIEIYKVGIPTAITQALGSIMVSAFNGILMPFSSTAVAFFGVYYKLQNFLFMPMNGLGQAAIPIVGYNYGDKNGQRIKDVICTMLPIGGGIAILGTIIFMTLPQQLLELFAASEDMLSIGIPALRIIAVTFVLSSITIILGYAVSGLGNGLINMIGTALRQFVIFVPLAYLFARLGGISYVWFSIWIAELIAVCYVVWSSYREFRKKVTPLILKYIPKESYTTPFSEELLKTFTDKLNHRPRKCLGWKSPFEVFFHRVLHLT